MSRPVAAGDRWRRIRRTALALAALGAGPAAAQAGSEFDYILLAAGGAMAASALFGAGCRLDGRPRVAAVRAASYADDLEPLLREALREVGFDRSRVAGRRFLLKPNLVETSIGAAQINTHPMVVRGAALALYGLGARDVVIGEGPGHRRDTALVPFTEAFVPEVDLAGGRAIIAPPEGLLDDEAENRDEERG